jgi:SAM-dependent methyltransferase
MALFKRYLYDNNSFYRAWGNEFQSALDDLRGGLSSGKLKFMFTRCICGSLDERTLFEKDRVGIYCRYVICLDCGLVRANPIMDEKSTEYFYRDYYQRVYHTDPDKVHSDVDEFEATASHSSNCYLPFLDLAPGKQILMIGCGTGGGLYPFQRAGHKCIGVDFAEEKIAFGKSMGLDLYAGHYNALLEMGVKADVVILSHVMEHFIDLREDFSNISAMLAERGIVFIDVPDILRTYLYPRGDILYGALFCHNYWFTLKSLNNTMSALGFRATGKHMHSWTSLIAVYERADKAEIVQDPQVAAKTLKVIKRIEYLYWLRKMVFADFFLQKLAVIVKRIPILKKMVYKLLKKE